MPHEIVEVTASADWETLSELGGFTVVDGDVPYVEQRLEDGRWIRLYPR